MGLPGSAIPDERSRRRRQVDRVIASPVLHGSESLCRLLRFLAEQAIDHKGTPIKEYQIATQLLGRPADFDPRLDSAVRVQTGRLRAKLAEYYAGPGAEDPLVIELPKGAYTLNFRDRKTEPQPRGTARPAGRGWAAVLSIALVAGTGWLVSPYWLPAQQSRPDADETFWRSFLNGAGAPLVVYSNAAFVGRPETGMRYFDPAVDAGKPVLDHYTGIGEVMAIHALDRVFSRLGQPLRLKRARLLTWDDAKSSSMIFVGSTAENESLRELPGTQDFSFDRKSSGARKGDLAILNRNPREGEPDVFLTSFSAELTEDYALVGLVSGPNPGRWILILAGLTTLGTQAAAEFVCERAGIEKLHAAMGGRLAPFEAVLRVQVNGGVPVRSEVVALRARPVTAATQAGPAPRLPASYR